ncbi:MAG: hypothetical protein OXB88_08890 [Bacteriovoracales bacterium]|nr:hypothetical protein [Bacteriovoracales bacterium]
MISTKNIPFFLFSALFVSGLSVSEVLACTTTVDLDGITTTSISKRGVSFVTNKNSGNLAGNESLRYRFTSTRTGVNTPTETATAFILRTTSGLTPGVDYSLEVAVVEGSTVCSYGGSPQQVTQTFTTLNDVPTRAMSGTRVDRNGGSETNITIHWNSLSLADTNHADGANLQYEVWQRQGNALDCRNARNETEARDCSCSPRGGIDYNWITNNMTRLITKDGRTTNSHTISNLSTDAAPYCYAVVPRNGEGIPPANHINLGNMAGHTVRTSPVSAPPPLFCSSRVDWGAITNFNSSYISSSTDYTLSGCSWAPLSGGLVTGYSAATDYRIRFQKRGESWTTFTPTSSLPSGALRRTENGGFSWLQFQAEGNELYFVQIRMSNVKGDSAWGPYSPPDEDAVLNTKEIGHWYHSEN